MSARDGAVPQNKRASPRVLIPLASLIIAVLVGGAWFFYKNASDEFTNLLSEFSAWLDGPTVTTGEPLDIARLQTRYEELRTDLMQALDSRHRETLLAFGRARLLDQIDLSLTHAEQAFDAGDVTDALRILENSSEQWHEAISEINAFDSHSATIASSRTIDSASAPGAPVEAGTDQQFPSAQLGAIDAGIPDQAPDADKEESFANVVLLRPVEKRRTIAAPTEQKTNNGQLSERGKISGSVIPESVRQQAMEVMISEDGELVIMRPDSSKENGEPSRPQTATTGPGGVTTTTIEKPPSEPPLEPSNAPVSEIVALVPRPAGDVTVTETVNPTSPGDHSDIDSNEQAKRQYEDSLRELDRVFPTLNRNATRVPGNARLVEDMQLKWQKAKEAYEDGDFNEAKRLIGLALVDAQTANAQENSHYQLNLGIAKDAYSKQITATAAEAIERAAALRPNSNEVLYWRERIEILPKLLQARQDAETARTMGRYQAEIDALERVVRYSSDGSEMAAQRIAELKKMVRDRNFTDTINRGMNALLDGNLEQARRELAQARRQRPASPQATKLQKGIDDAERGQEIARHLAAGLKAWKNDDWNNTLIHYQRVLAIDPTFDEAVQGHEFATTIIGLQRKIDGFLAKPHRLSSAKIAAAANSVIGNASTYGAFSPKLKSSANSLALAIDEWRTPVAVRVMSDGKTNIGIRGVGKIGKIEERLVELLPGTYMFEGNREGYRSKLIELVVRNNSEDSMEITVICHERS